MARMRGFLLSEDDKAILRRLIEEARQARAGLTAESRFVEEGEADETYISRAPAGGIPGMRLERNGDNLFVIPGQADCKLYSILKDAGPVSIVQIPNRTKVVFNPDPDPVKENTWILIKKEKFGDWVIAEVYSESATGTGTYMPTGTGTLLTGTGTRTGTGTGPAPPPPPPPPGSSVEFLQYDLECEGGVLNKYGRTVTISITNGALSRTYGVWFFISNEGCCECTQKTGTGTGTGTGTVVPIPPYTGTGTGYPYHDNVDCQNISSKTNLWLTMEVTCRLQPFGYTCDNCQNDIIFYNQKMLKVVGDYEWLTGEIPEGSSTNEWGLQCYQGPNGPEWSFYSATSVCFNPGSSNWTLNSIRANPFEMDWILHATGQGNDLNCPHCTTNMNLTMLAKIREVST